LRKHTTWYKAQIWLQCKISGKLIIFCFIHIFDAKFDYLFVINSMWNQVLYIYIENKCHLVEHDRWQGAPLYGVFLGFLPSAWMPLYNFALVYVLGNMLLRRNDIFYFIPLILFFHLYSWLTGTSFQDSSFLSLIYLIWDFIYDNQVFSQPSCLLYFAIAAHCTCSSY
jgi:hypothetical protein